jgi:hypothetical protein
MFARTPPEKLVDAKGRPYFLWDVEMTLDEFQSRLKDPDPEVRGYLTGKLMRQAKPDDVFTFVSVDEIVDLWPELEKYLGRTQEFWRWILGAWGRKLPLSDRPGPAAGGDRDVAANTPRLLLVGELCAILGRADIRPLQDVLVLPEAGTDLADAAVEETAKDGGLSPPTLAWVLNGREATRLARLAGISEHEATDLDRFRRKLAEKLRDLSSPSPS